MDPLQDLREEYEYASGNTVTDEDCILDDQGRFVCMYDDAMAEDYLNACAEE